LVLAVRVERTQPVLQTGMRPLHQTRMEEEHRIELSTFRLVGCSKPVASHSHVLPNPNIYPDIMSE